LQDMGVEPFLLTHSLKMVIAQRLIRKICPHCKTEDRLGVQGLTNYLPGLIKPDAVYYRGKGCEYCHSTGFSGRMVIGEHFIVDDELSALILQNTPLTKLRAMVVKKGFKNLWEDGLEKALSGQTSLPEVMREITLL